MFKQILFTILLICSLNFLICHEDEDTEFINNSFLEQISNLHVPRKKCKVRAAISLKWFATGKKPCKKWRKLCTFTGWIMPTNKFDVPKEMPTCLKEFYEIAYVPICGKPMYNKFKNCAKALHHYQKEKDPNAILVLFDGCVWCPQWSERSTNVQIELGLKTDSKKVKEYFKAAITTTVSDRYADFKIGAIFNLFDQKRWQFEYYLKITHQCNQYNMIQEKILVFPHFVHKVPEKIIEHTNFEIKLPQGSGKRKEVIVMN